MTWLAEMVAELYHALDIEEAMRVLGELTRFDRYQGSAGIDAAAEFVARSAEQAGLTDVRILRFPADGETRWWTFTAPVSWTPHSASLSIAGDPGALVAYPEPPYSLAANSVSTSGVGAGEAPRVLPIAEAVESTWPRGALVLVESISSLGPDLFGRLRDERAAGFVVVTHPDRPGHVGRVELPPDSGLFAFSLDPERFARLRDAARSRRRAAVTVDVDTSPAFMPVVTARTPQGGPRECLITAHLCHPAPGANDNASGVAAALAVGRVLTRTDRPLRHAVRFVWGPEFVGLAAYLHARAGSEYERWQRPVVAVNLDMVGEDQRQCGGPLIIEHCPDYLPHFVNALADAVVGALPQASRSYGGAVPCDVWSWRGTPYVGASDHSLLVDRSIGCPAIQIGHWPDRYNHSAADGLDKVDPQELRRSAAIAASVLCAVCDDDPAHAPDLTRLVSRWIALRMVSCLPSPADNAFDSLWMRRLDRIGEAGIGALRSLRDFGITQEALRVHEAWIADLHARLRAVAAGDYDDSVLEFRENLGTDRGEPPLTRAWPGPFNLRALLGRCAADDRRRLEQELAADRARFYATAMALAQGIDGSTGTELVIERAALDCGLEIERAFARRFLGALVRAGWAVAREPDGPHARGGAHGPHAPPEGEHPRRAEAGTSTDPRSARRR